MQPYDPTQPLLHLHVPKTGGSSVRAALRQWYGDDLVVFQPWERPRLEAGGIYSGHYDRRWAMTVFGDHVDLAEAPRAIPPAQYITWLRDPFDQLRSMYDYWRRSCAGVVGFHGRPARRLRDYAMSFEQFVRQCPCDWWAWLPDPQRPELFDGFFFVGVVERMQDCLNALADRLGKPRIRAPREMCAKHDPLPGPVERRLRRIYRRLRPQWHIAWQHVLRTWSVQW